MIFFIPLLFFGFALIVFFLFYKNFFRQEVKRSLDSRLFLVKVPRDFISEDQKQQFKNFSSFAALFEQFIEAFSKYKKEIIFELAIPFNTKEICFYLACFKKDVDFVIKNLSALFPYSQIEQIKEDYTIFCPNYKISAAYLTLKDYFCLPIKTFKNFEQDPLDSMITAMTKIELEEGAAIQLVLKTADNSFKKKLNKIRESILKGSSLKEAIVSPKEMIFKTLKDINKAKEKEEKEKVPKIDENLIRAIEEKSQFPLFNVNLRLITSARTKERADELLAHLEGAFIPLNNPLGNSFKIHKIKFKNALKRIIYQFAFRLPDYKNSLILNSLEIASIFHLPHPFIDNSQIKWLKAKSAPAPLNIPTTGSLLGINIYAGEEKEIRILDEDRRRHIYIVGQTGTGKSTLLKNMFIEDINKGKGVCFIDPHGDTAEEILGFIPENRFHDVIYFNPGDYKRSFGLNMLEWDKKYPFQKSFITNELLEILDKLYDLKTVGGPVFEQYFRNAILLLLDDPDEIHTLTDLPRILINPDFRKKLLEKTPNPLTKEFWLKEAEKAGGELALANVAPYINSKLNPFLANDLVRPIIGQIHSSIDFRKVMDEGKILIVNLSKGLLGDTNSYLIGMITVGKLLMAAFSRVDILEDQRKDFYLYIDEFQNITTDTVSTIFSEARKYRLNLTVANQYLAQLKEPILKSVFGNVGTLIAFRVGKDDADFLMKYFEPVFNAYDLMNLDNFNAYIKLMINNQTSRAFNIKTIRPPKPDFQKINYLKEYSSLQYSVPREEVEAEIRRRYERI
ncbi:MAG: helicase HerA domain-containing protein [Minisyncoccia bacterium]